MWPEMGKGALASWFGSKSASIATTPGTSMKGQPLLSRRGLGHGQRLSDCRRKHAP